MMPMAGQHRSQPKPAPAGWSAAPATAPSGKPLRAWGPGQTAAATTCPTEAAPVPILDTSYDDVDRAVQTTQYLTAAQGGNRISQIVYNADDSVNSIKKAVGSAVAQTYAWYGYNPNGTLSYVADAKGNLTASFYDGQDRLQYLAYPNPSTAGNSNTDFEQYTYDNNGQQTQRRTRSGQIITQTWDSLGRLEQPQLLQQRRRQRPICV